jgi:uncharacterized protein YlbG (UPF0298 family)
MKVLIICCVGSDKLIFTRKYPKFVSNFVVYINEGFVQDIVTKIRTSAYIVIVTRSIYAGVLIFD